jgi:hypothetical protein
MIDIQDHSRCVQEGKRNHDGPYEDKDGVYERV